MTSEEKQEIINAVLAALRTNSKSINQLTPVSEMSEEDFLELNGGRKVSYGVLFANHMSNEEAQEGWEYLDTKKVDKDSRGLVEVHQAPVIYLDAMGNLDGHALSGSEGLEYRTDTKLIYDFPGGLYGAPKGGAVYISKNNFKKFVWNGTDLEELKVDECPLFVDYSEPVAFATLPVGGSYYVPSSHKIAVKIDASNTKTYDPLPDALYFFRDKGKVYTWNSSTNKWVPAGSDINVVNNLTDGGEADALSAEQGKRLKRLIDQSGVSVEVVDNRLCIMATSGASKTSAPTINAEIQTDGRALVTITAADSGTAITYSINGGETQNYSQPFYIDTVGTSTITAKAQADGELPSNTVTATVTTESAGTVTIAKGTDDNTVQSVAFTATASDPTATVTISIGQQTQSGTGTATLSVAKTDEVQTVAVTATASVTGKIAATATQEFTVSRSPNKLLQGTSTNAVTDLYIGSKHYTTDASTTEDGMVIDNDTVDGVNVWTLDFEVDNGDGTKTYHDEITSLMRGTNGTENGSNANIFGSVGNSSSEATNILSIDKFPDCVTAIGKQALRWCSNIKVLGVRDSSITVIDDALYNCPAVFVADNKNFNYMSGLKGSGVVAVDSEFIGTLYSSSAAIGYFASTLKLVYFIGEKYTGTASSGGNFSGCTALRYIEFGTPTPNNGVYSSNVHGGDRKLNKYFIQNCNNLKAVVIYDSTPPVTDTPSDDTLFLGIGNDVVFYVPDDAVDTYKNHANWQYVANRIKGFNDEDNPKPARPRIVTDNASKYEIEFEGETITINKS